MELVLELMVAKEMEVDGIQLMVVEVAGLQGAEVAD